MAELGFNGVFLREPKLPASTLSLLLCSFGGLQFALLVFPWCFLALRIVANSMNGQNKYRLGLLGCSGTQEKQKGSREKHLLIPTLASPRVLS